MPNIIKSSQNLEQYFNNGKRGNKNPYTIQNVNNQNINVKVYYNKLNNQKLKNIKLEVAKVLKDYSIQGLIDKPKTLKTIKLYVFNKRSDYLYYGEKLKLKLGDSFGITFPGIEQDVAANIYVYQNGGIVNLKHEFIHAFNMIGKVNKLPSLISEGLAQMFEYPLNPSIQGQSADFSLQYVHKVIGDFDLNKMLNLSYSQEYIPNTFLYELGHALVLYFNQKNKELIPSYLMEYESNIQHANAILSENYNKEDFKKFLQENMTETEMKAINALKVVKGERILEVLEWRKTSYEKIIYYKADIQTIEGKKVGEFSSVVHSFSNNDSNPIIRVDGAQTLYISPEYHYMKVIRTDKGDLKLVYCNEAGNEYKDSLEYKNQVKNIKNKLLDIQDYPTVIEELSYFDLNSVQDIQGHKFSNYFIEDHIFALKSPSVEKDQMVYGISIFYNDQKIAELSGNSARVRIWNGEDSQSIYFQNLFQNLYSRYVDVAYIGIQKEQNNNYKITILEGKQFSKDEYFDIPHIHFNTILHLNNNVINDREKESLLLNQGVNLLNHKDSEIAQYPKDYSINHPAVKIGKLLNDHGTEAKYDDIYESEVELGSRLIFNFKNISFRITSDTETLTITDYAKNIGYAFPKATTHLKLRKIINNAMGKYVLVPCTKDGNEFPEGQPQIPDKYRLIDTIFAHDYEKEEHSHEHVTIGLIDFSKYTEGTLFRMHHDPNDAAIIKDEEGNILKLEDTKVKLYDPTGKEIGILSRDYHHFKGDIFFSIDENYHLGFFASYTPYLGPHRLADGTRAVFFEQMKGDLTNNNYNDYKYIPIHSKIIDTHNVSDKTVNNDIKHHEESDSSEKAISTLNDDPNVNNDTTQKSDVIVFLYDDSKYHVAQCNEKNVSEIESKTIDLNNVYDSFKMCNAIQTTNLPVDMTWIIYHKQSKILYDSTHVELHLQETNEHYNVKNQDTIKLVSDTYQYIYHHIDHEVQMHYWDFDHNTVVAHIKNGYDIM